MLARGRYNNVFLERCGTSKRRLLVNDGLGGVLGSDAKAIVWQTASHLTGLFLPSLQKFTILLPRAILNEHVPVLSLVLTPGALYVEDGYYGTFWRTASPTALPVNTSRPSLTRSGSTLACRRGSWRNAERFSYAWHLDGTTHRGANPNLAVDRSGSSRSARCSVTASNAVGTTTASSPQLGVG